MRHITQIKKILYQESMFGAVIKKPIKQQLTKFNRRRFPGGKDYCSKN